MLPPRMQALLVQLEYVEEKSAEQEALLGELRFFDEFSYGLVHRIGATVPPGPRNPPKTCTTCGKPLP
jgi:hypothetical protein